MKGQVCRSCGRDSLSRDEVGICKKLLGMRTRNYFCIDCLAAYLDTSVEELLEQIEEFKEEGCKLFL